MPRVSATQTVEKLPVCEHLIRRGGRYYIRRRVPQDLIAHYGKGEVNKALGTADPKAAAKLCRAEAVRLDQEWDATRASLTATPDALPASSQPSSITNPAMRAAQALASLRQQQATAREQGYDVLQAWTEKQTFAMQLDHEVLQGGFEPVLSIAEHEAGYHARLALLTGEGAVALSVLPLTPNTPVTGKRTPIDTVMALWEREKPRQQQTMDAKRAEIGRYCTMTGITCIEDITKASARDFRDKMLANDYTAKNTNKYLNSLRALLNFAVSEDLIPGNPANGIKAAVKDSEEDDRKPFSLDALSTIFNSPVYAKGDRPLGGGGEAAYWLPLLGLFTGARLEELGQLHPDDVHEESTPDMSLTAWVIRVRNGEGQHLKNTGTNRRRIPMHQALIDLGFLDYVKAAKAKQQHRIFDKLKLNKYGKHTDAWSKWFGRYLRQTCGIKDTALVFHSFRHTFKDYCRAASIPEDVHDALSGHGSDSVARQYGGSYPLAPMVENMKRYKVYGLVLSPASKSPA